MTRRKALVAAGLAVVLSALAGIGIAAAGSKGTEGGFGRPAQARSLRRIRQHNLRLTSYLLLLEQQGVEAPTQFAQEARLESNPGRRPKGSTPAVAENESSCDPNYEGACLSAGSVDYDCEGGSGNGPDYIGEVIVVGEDHFGLDADGDGVGCE